jgi:hypothetical protein
MSCLHKLIFLEIACDSFLDICMTILFQGIACMIFILFLKSVADFSIL